MSDLGRDLFADKASDYDARSVPQQISEGVGQALRAAVPLRPDMTVLDFGAGTGLLCGQIAPHVARIIAVDISAAMLERLAAKPELVSTVEIRCQDLLEAPLGEQVDLVVSAMAMHHVHDTDALLAALAAHVRPGGQVALADLDTEEGDFHPPNLEGVFHPGFDRAQLAAGLERVGFVSPRFVTATAIEREGKNYPIFLVTATMPG